jgi:hypothetical protein
MSRAAIRVAMTAEESEFLQLSLGEQLFFPNAGNAP